MLGDRKSVLLIDEPELSLNIKWQRKLIQALRDIVPQKKVQFVFVTHSIEFLSEYVDNVVKPRTGRQSRIAATGEQSCRRVS
jgi:ABC-type sulfate/molybdate transport systems ATPase subunit